MGGEAKPNPPMLEAAVPSPNTLPAEEPIALLNDGADPNAAAPPNAGEPPKEGGLPNTGALPKPPGFVGVENEPKPWDATLPAPVLKVPAGFCSPKDDCCPKPKALAPLFPNKLLAPVCEGCPKPPEEAVAPNGFLLAASSLGLPPRPLKNPPPAVEPGALAELEPNRPPPDDGCCWPNTLPVPPCCPNTGVAEEQPKPEGCPKLNPDDEDVVVLLPNTGACPNPELCPNAGAVLCPNRPVPVLLAVLALLVPKEKELALLAVEAPKRPLPPVVALLEFAPNAAWPKEKLLAVPVLLAG